MEITNAKYFKDLVSNEIILIHAFINGIESSVGLSTDNYHYVEIMRQVDAGELTIEPADE